MSNNDTETAPTTVDNQSLTSPRLGEQAQGEEKEQPTANPQEPQQAAGVEEGNDTVVVASTSGGTVTVEAPVEEEDAIHADGRQGDTSKLPADSAAVLAEVTPQEQQHDGNTALSDFVPQEPSESQTEDTTATASTADPTSNTASVPSDDDGAAVNAADTHVDATEASTSSTAATAPQSATMEPSTSTTSATGSGSASTPATVSHSARPAVAAKKFTSSLSMNKKFLEKSGASALDGKSPQPPSLPLPKVGLAAARSPSYTSPATPAPGSSTASPTLANAAPATTNTAAAGTSHPRLLTGKLSTLGGSGTGMMSAPGSAPATWGRPLGPSAIGTSTSTSFGRGGFVPAAPVGGSGFEAGRGFPNHNQPPMSAGFARGRGFAFGGNHAGAGRGGPSGPMMGPGLTGRRGSNAGQQGLPWGHAGRGGPSQSGGRGGMLEQEFPSFQETARAEEQRQHAMIAKEKAEKMAAVAQAAYNQRLLDDLKGFSGVHNESGGMAWDQMDDEDDLEDILEFADGMRYEVTHSTAQPTEAEEAAFKAAEKASNEAAALHAQYEIQVAADAAQESQKQKGQISSSQEQYQEVDGPADYGKKADMFEDDFNRGTRDSRPAVAHPVATGQALLGRGDPANRTLFNDRLGKFEPYGGRPQSGKHNKDRKVSPPSVLQRVPAGKGPDHPGKNNAKTPQLQNGSQQASAPTLAGRQPPKNAAVPPIDRNQEAKANPAQAKKAESPWAKLPPVAIEPLQSIANSAQPSARVAPQQISQQPSIQQKPPQPQKQSTAPASIAAGPAAQASQPSEDPEEAYKRQMQSIAERARKRREGEELDRLAAVERAKQKAAELEARMMQAAAAKVEKASSPTVPMTAPLPPTASSPSIISPPAGQQQMANGRPDRQSSWRRQSLSNAAPSPESRNVPPQQRTLWQPPKPAPPALKEEAKVAEKSKPVPIAASAAPVAKPLVSPAKLPPSADAFAAFADMASANWRKPIPPPPAPARTHSQAMEPVVQEHDSVLPETDAVVTPSVPIRSPLPPDQQPATPKLSSPKLASDMTSPPPLTAPTVKLGKLPSPSLRSPTSVPTSSTSHAAILLSHAFPQPTIIVPPRADLPDRIADSSMLAINADSPPQLTALEKIMLQVKAAQDDLKVKAPEQNRPVKPEFDGPLSRISKAMEGGKAYKGKETEIQPVLPKISYTPEVFDITKVERPSTPRSWNTYKVKLPTQKRTLEHIPALKLRHFTDARLPMPVYSSTWVQPRGLQLPRLLMLEDYLNPKLAEGDFPRVKVSKLHLPSDLVYPPSEPELAGSSGAITISPAMGNSTSSISGLGESITWRRVSVSMDAIPVPSTPIEVHITRESVTVKDPPDDEYIVQEDFTTVPMEEPTEVPASIKVSLPRSSPAKPNPPVSPETARFKAYGPKVADNATVVFRRGLSPAKEIEVTQPSSSSMFLSPSEIGAKAEKIADEASEDRGLYAQIPQEEPRREVQRAVGLSRSMEALNGKPSYKLSSPTVPAFPSLSPGLDNLPSLPSPRTAVSASSPAPTSSFDINEKPHIPPHILEQLKKLNDTVSATPLTVAPRLDSPNHFLARTASPWATAGMIPHMGSSAFSLSAIDPSMSVWSKPTEETAAAASAAKDKSGETRQENSLRGIADDYPSMMPSSALDLPISESESQYQERTASSSGSRIQPLDRARASEERFKNRVVSAPAPINMPLTGRPRMPSTSGSGSSRQNSYNQPASYSYDGSIPSPYAVHASLPFSPVGMPGPSAAFSPTMTHAQPAYTQYVASTPYGHGFTSAMPSSSSGMTAVPAGYTQVPTTLATIDGRHVWVQASQVPAGMMHGQYSSVGSPYSTGPAAYSTMHIHPSQSKTRVPASPVYSHHAPSQRGSAPIRMEAASPFPYAYSSAGSHPPAQQQHYAQAPSSSSHAAYSPQHYPQHMRAPGSSSQFSRRTASSQHHEQAPSW